MAIVPQYKPSVAERPILQANLTTRASAADFGSAIGQGLQQVGQGLGQAAQEFGTLRDLEDQMRAKEADNAFAAWKREADYGAGGYMTLEGQAAVDGRDAYVQTLEDKRREFGSGLSGGASQMYGQASQARVNSALDSSIVHAAGERKKWFNDTASARLDTFAEDALAVWNNPAKVDTNIAAGQAEIRQQGAMLGWGADVLANKEAQYISDVRKNIALRHMMDDPIAAKAYIEEHRSELTGQAQFELDETIQAPLVNAQGVSAATDFLTNGQRTYGAAPENEGQGPTNARAFLMERSVNPRAAHIDNLDGAFANNLAALLQDAPFEGLGVLSGNRTQEEQIALFEGSDKSGRMVAFPIGYKKPDGTISNGSNHQHGNAVDISYNGRSLKHAPPEVIAWVHKNAGGYGLTFPMSWENWHIEPAGVRGGSTAVANTGQTTARAQGPSWASMEEYLRTIPDPKVRDVARTAITAQINASTKDQEAQRKAVGEQAFSEMVTQNVSPFSFTPEVQAALGMETMSSLMTYWDKQAAGEKIETKPELLYQMQTAYATDPVAFAEVDLLQYRSQLSDSDWKTVTDWRQTALTDQRKATEEGMTLSSAFSASTTALEAAGITMVGKDEAARAEAAKQIAMFNNVLTQQMAEFRTRNEGRAPNDAEIQQITNRLLLPIVIKPAAVDDGFFGNHFFGMGLPKPIDARLFEAGARPDGTTVDVNVQYQDIPIDMRDTLKLTLIRELGREPTEEEVISEYEAFFLGM